MTSIGGHVHQHACPNCGEQTYGATNSDGGTAGQFLCQPCFDAYYVEDDEAEFERRRARRTER